MAEALETRRASETDVRWLALAATAGVLAVHALHALPPLPALLAVACPAFLPWRGRLLWSAFVLGMLSAAWQGQGYLDARWPAQRHGEVVDVRGEVTSLPESSAEVDGANGNDAQRTLRFSFRPDDPSLPRNIRVSWYRADQIVRGGECWSLTLRMRTPHGSFNPHGFDYEGWLYLHDVGATASVKAATRCDTVPQASLLSFRQTLKDRFTAWLPGHPALPLLAALSIGDDSGLRDADWESFRLTGTTHLVAISGFNVAIIAGFAFFIARWLWVLVPGAALRLPAQKAGLIFAAAVGLAYSLLAGWDSPVQRAALMLVALLLAAAADRLSQPSRVLAAVWLLMLVFDPPAVRSPGLWLSFGAVAAIFFVSTGRLRRYRAWREALWLQLMLSVVLAPVTMLFFHGAAPLGLIVNLVAVPIMALLTPVILVALMAALALPAVGVPVLRLTADTLALLQDGLFAMAQWGHSSWIPAAPPLASIVLALLGALLLFMPRGWPGRWLGLVCVAPIFLHAPRPPPGGLEVTALDVGQGLAVLLRTPHHALLYDAGPAFEDGFDAGESVVAPYILGLGLHRLDMLLLSHGDNDHAGGVPAARRLLRIDRELGTSGHAPCRDGQHWEWDGIRFSVLHPDDGAASDNNRSCVLRVDGPYSVLLTGDIEKAAEARLLEVHPDRLKADLLIAPHHGSKTSSTEAFVHAVSPRRVIFGAAWRSHFGHPRPEVVARYRDAGALPAVTGVEGAVRLWQGESGRIESESWRIESARFWNAPAEP
jgi:competence protein ComEC